MLWHEQSWPVIEQLHADTPVVVPLGSIEQHGHHLPLMVDTLQVENIASRVEQRLSDKVLLTPTLWLGSSHHHKDFAGTISVPPSVYSQMIIHLAKSILAAGFRRILFLNGHGGNLVPATQALTELVASDDRADDAYLTLSCWWQIASSKILPNQHGMTTPSISHACEYETSLVMALRPELVHKDRIQTHAPPIESRFYPSDYGGSVGVFRRFHRLTASGSMGSPAEATKEKGESLMTSVVDETVAYIEDLMTWPALPPLKRESARQ